MKKLYFCVLAFACLMTACNSSVTKGTEIMKDQNVVVQAEGEWEEKRAYRELLQEAEKYVANEEIQYLASLNEEQANNRIILILNQKPIEGVEAAEKACLGKDVYNGDFDEELDTPSNDLPLELKEFRRYMAWCGKHNSQCNSVLSIAIACRNESLAKKILHSFRPDPELQLVHSRPKKDDSYEDYYDVYAHYTNTSKDAAQKKYDEAVKSGAFN